LLLETPDTPSLGILGKRHFGELRADFIVLLHIAACALQPEGHRLTMDTLAQDIIGGQARQITAG
jgi:hypothetical protein